MFSGKYKVLANAAGRASDPATYAERNRSALLEEIAKLKGSGDGRGEIVGFWRALFHEERSWFATVIGCVDPGFLAYFLLWVDEDEVAGRGKLYKQLADLTKRADGLEADLVAVRRNAARRAKLDESKSGDDPESIKNLQYVLKLRAATINTLERDVSNFIDRIRGLNAQIETLGKELGDLRTVNDGLHIQIGNLADMVADRDERIAKLEASEQLKVAGVESLQRAQQRARDEIRGLKARLKEAENELIRERAKTAAIRVEAQGLAAGVVSENYGRELYRVVVKTHGDGATGGTASLYMVRADTRLQAIRKASFLDNRRRAGRMAKRISINACVAFKPGDDSIKLWKVWFAVRDERGTIHVLARTPETARQEARAILAESLGLSEMFIVTTGGEEFNPAGIGELYAATVPGSVVPVPFRAASLYAAANMPKGTTEAVAYYVWQRQALGAYRFGGDTSFDLYETPISGD